MQHTIILYSSKATIDGLPYSMGAGDGAYALIAPNPVHDLLPNVAALVLVEIDRVTGDYEISAGPDNAAQKETGRCEKTRRRL